MRHREARAGCGDEARRWRASRPARGVRALLACAVLCLAGLMTVTVAEAAPRVLGFSTETRDGETRLVFRLSERVSFDLFTLAGPPRLVLDFPALTWPGGPPAGAAQAPVAGIRHGTFRPGRTRMVIELTRPMAVRMAGITGQPGAPRLEIALAPSSAERFAATAGRPPGARWRAQDRPPAPPPGDIVVAIDPGHGGIDPGARRGGLVEKEIVLEIAHLLADRLTAARGITPYLTREDDRFIPLGARIRLARAAGAHLFVSLHADALEWGEATGVSVYTLSRRGADAAADAFAERENRSNVIAGAELSGVGDDVTRLLIDLARRGAQAESVRLAEALVIALGERVDLLDTRPHRRGNFYVLKAPDLPSVLVELGFLTSAEDRARLSDPAWRDRVVARIAAGIRAWIDSADPAYLAPRE